MKNSDFKVMGKEELINNLTINIQKGYINKNIENLISKGTINKVIPSEEGIYIYYISYKDQLVNKIVDDVFYGVSDPIHIFYIEEKENQIIVTFIGRESELEAKKGYKVMLLPREEYYKINNIDSTDEIKKTEFFFR